MQLLTNGRLITRDPDHPYFEKGAVAFEGTKIVEVGSEADLAAKYPDAKRIDAKGGVIMPALINAHTHIYSALARGLSIVGNNPTNFYEVLDGTWWAIDRKLTLAGTKASADALYIDCIKQGVTTIFDHHASYCEIPGSLFKIAESAKEFGVRSCLCYEVSDRDGEEKCLQGIQENADFDGKTLSGDGNVFFIVELDKEHSGFLDFDIELGEDCDIDVGYGEHLLDGLCRTIHNLDYTAVIHGKKGSNLFTEKFRRFGCRYIQFFIHSNKVKINYAGLRPTEYPITFKPLICHLQQRI